MSDRHPSHELIELLTRAGSPFSPTERLVGMIVAHHLHKERGVAWPALPRICDQTGLSRNAVRKALVALCEGPGAVLERTPGGTEPGGTPQPAQYSLRAAAGRSKTSTDRGTRRPGHVVTGSRGDTNRVTSCAVPGHQVTPNNETNYETNKQQPPLSPPLARVGTAPRPVSKRDKHGLDDLADDVARHWRDLGGKPDGFRRERRRIRRRLEAGEDADAMKRAYTEHAQAEAADIERQCDDQADASRRWDLARQCDDYVARRQELSPGEARKLWVATSQIAAGDVDNVLMLAELVHRQREAGTVQRFSDRSPPAQLQSTG